MELPLHRDRFRAKFEGGTIPFRTRGWDRTWQLINLKFGLEMSYRWFTLGAEYNGDISPASDTPYKSQRASVQCRWVF